MGVQIVVADPALYNAAKNFTLSTPILGFNNAFEVLESIGLRIKSKPVRSKGICNSKNQLEAKVSNVIFQMKSDPYIELLDAILSVLDTDANAQYLLPILLPSWMLDFSQFDLVGDYYTSDAGGGNLPVFNVVPNFQDIWYEGGGAGLKSGLYGDTILGVDGFQMSRATATTLKAKLNSKFNGKTMIFDVFDNDSTKISSDDSAAVSSKELSLSITTAAGSYTGGYMEMKSLIYKVKSDSSKFMMDIDLAKIEGVFKVNALGYKA